MISIAAYSQNSQATEVISEDLSQKMISSSSDELIPINIFLSDKYPTNELFKRTMGMHSDNKREFVKTELKAFTENSQSSLKQFLSSKAVTNNIEEGHYFWITNVVSCKATSGVIDELSHRQDIERIDHDEIRYMLIGEKSGIDDDPNQTHGINEITNNVIKVNAPAVWDLGYTGQGVIVAVLDVGVNYNHADLEDHMWDHPDYPNHGYDFAYNDNDPMDNHGHGTHCAGTIAGDGTAGSQTGMAPDATIMALKILNDQGGGAESDSWEAIEFAIDYDVDILSMSIGWMHAYNPARSTWRETLDNALAAGVVAAIAAGNEGGSPSNPDDVRTPGDCPPPWLNPDQTLIGGISACICIGATDNNDNLASFSARGPSDWEAISPFNDYPFNPELGLIRPDVCAPGVNIKSCNAFNINGYTSMSGTSMATPGVAGIMALLMSKVPSLTPAAINIALETTAVDLGATGKDNLYGAGRVDALVAINSLIEMYSPINLQIETNQETGESSMTWDHPGGLGFEYFKIYRDGIEIDTSASMDFTDQLPGYDYYLYEITAYYGGTDESDPVVKQTQWGSSTIEVYPGSFTSAIMPNETEDHIMVVKNMGVLDLDYSLSPFFRNVAIADWITVEPDNGVILVGDSMNVVLKFNSTDKELGTYTETLNFVTNDMVNTNVYVDLTMHVTDMTLAASADPEVICFGSNTQLTAEAVGGLGTYQYSWTSVPEGFVSDEASPMVEPEENTTYFVSVSSGSVTLDKSVFVTVNQLPEVDLGTDEVLCGETQTDLDAGNPGSDYLWSTDEVTQTIMGSGSGVTMFWAEVTNENGCKGYDTVYVDFAEIPIVELGSDTTLCAGTTITLDAGNAGSAYLWSNLETTQSILIDTVGYGYGTQDIYVDVTNTSGCNNIGEISLEFVDCTGINELSDVDIKVYPNPTSGIITMDLTSESNKPVVIRITNVSGKVIQEINDIVISGSHTQKVDLSDYSDGIYTLTIVKEGSYKSSTIVLRK